MGMERKEQEKENDKNEKKRPGGGGPQRLGRCVEKSYIEIILDSRAFVGHAAMQGGDLD